MPGAPRSEIFDDVYFSAQDGLAETRHVFLAGNNLPQSWAGQEQYVIAETGFGTGLNFVVTWEMFEAQALPHQRLHYISFEKYPLDKAFILKTLSAALGDRDGGAYRPYIQTLCDRYPALIPGYHRVVLNPRVALTLVFEDVNSAMPALAARVNAWFLDGFKPASNPDMWSETVFKNMARLSAPSATFSTFTAAGFVRRGLRTAGFEVQKAPGFGRKREMLVGMKL